MFFSGPVRRLTRRNWATLDILILVHQQVFVLVLVELTDVLVLRQQDDRLVDEVVEVESTSFFELPLVGGVDLGREGALGVPGGGAQGLFGADELVFPAAHLVDYDTDDAQRVMKTVYKELSVDDKFFPIKSAINQMSRWKDQLISPSKSKAPASLSFRS